MVLTFIIIYDIYISMNRGPEHMPERDLTPEQERAIETAMNRGLSMADAVNQVLSGIPSGQSGEYDRTHTGPTDIIPFLMSKTLLQQPEYQAELPLDELKSPATKLREAWIDRVALEEQFATLEFSLGRSPRLVALERAKGRTAEELREAIALMQAKRV
jgi:hypothetical protein